MPQLIDQPEPLTGKPPISEKKLAANRANAQKSTGPRTDAGKAVSRRNAAKHFMTGDGIVLPAEMDDQIEREIAAVAARLAPVDDYDWRLVREAAVAGVRFDRLVQIQEANLVLNVNKAARAWDELREDRVAALASILDHDPAHAVRMLKRFTEGCDYLWDAWDALQTKLDRAGSWNQDDYRQALHLLGADAAPTANDDGKTATMTLCALGVHLDRADVADRAAAFFDLDPDQAIELLPDPDEALAALLDLIEQLKADLRTLADRLWDLNDARDRAGAPTRALIDLSPEGKRLYRYEQDALRIRDRALGELKARRNNAAQPAASRPTAPGSMPPIPRFVPLPARNEPETVNPVSDSQPPGRETNPRPPAQSCRSCAQSRPATVKNSPPIPPGDHPSRSEPGDYC